MVQDMGQNNTSRWHRNWLLFAVCGAGAVGICTVASAQSPYAQAGLGERLVIVELYTSQGCASCPPADQLQAELAERGDVLPLTFPVDYWDYLGWRDTLARAGNAKRQMAYAEHSQSARVFTPQMIIDGVYSAIAGRRSEVLARIAEREESPDPSVRIAIKVSGGQISVSVPADRERMAKPDSRASVWLFPFGKTDIVHISEGENRGRSVRYTHVVRDIVMMGEWTGKATTFEHTLAARDREQFGYAVILQDRGIGPVIAAAWAGDRGRMIPAAQPPQPPILADPLLVNLQH
jgi:hypothetical protein